MTLFICSAAVASVQLCWMKLLMLLMRVVLLIMYRTMGVQYFLFCFETRSQMHFNTYTRKSMKQFLAETLPNSRQNFANICEKMKFPRNYQKFTNNTKSYDKLRKLPKQFRKLLEVSKCIENPEKFQKKIQRQFLKNHLRVHNVKRRVTKLPLSNKIIPINSKI